MGGGEEKAFSFVLRCLRLQTNNRQRSNAASNNKSIKIPIAKTELNFMANQFLFIRADGRRFRRPIFDY